MCRGGIEMVRYNPTFLDNTDVVSQEDLTKLMDLASKIDFNKLVSNSRIIEELGLDFIYTQLRLKVIPMISLTRLR